MNKKAILAFDIMMWVIKLIILVTGATVVVFVIYMLVVNDVGVEHLRSQIFVERILSSPDCISYYNEDIDRVYPNIIDMAKFRNKEKLAECIDYGSKKVIAAKITLDNLDTGANIGISYYNEDEFNKWLPFSFDERFYLRTTKERYVMIKEGDVMIKGRLDIEIVTPTG
ncbi:MAG: hypothetical protein ABIJ08_03565 [Nanoarchaeota archaeon]